MEYTNGTYWGITEDDLENWLIEIVKGQAGAVNWVQGTVQGTMFTLLSSCPYSFSCQIQIIDNADEIYLSYAIALPTYASASFYTFNRTTTQVAVPDGIYRLRVKISDGEVDDAIFLSDPIEVVTVDVDWFAQEYTYRLQKMAELTWLEGDTNTQITDERTKFLKTKIAEILATPPSFKDDAFEIVDNADITKKIKFQLDALESGDTRLLDAPKFSGRLMVKKDVSNRIGFVDFLSTDYASIPASSTTITMNVDKTSVLKVGDVVEIVIAGVAQNNLIVAVTASLLTVTGVPISGTIQALRYFPGSNTRVEFFNIAIQDAAVAEWSTYQSGGILTDVLNNARRKKILNAGPGYIVGFQTYCYAQDTSATLLQINLSNGGNAVNAATVATTAAYKAIDQAYAIISGLKPIVLNIPNAGGNKNTFQAEVNLYVFNFDQYED